MGSIFCIISFFILLSISSCAQFDSHNERCNLFPERGTCHHDFQMKWYYHPYSGRCKKFFYSGCDGNDNRFDSEEECLSQCTYGREGQEIENYKRCHEPYDKGDCWGSFERWYFDTDKGECICTNYTGCGGTGNKFYSFNHCMEICGDFSKNNYQKNYYEKSEHGQAKRQRLQNYNQQLPRRQESGDINLQAQQQYYDNRIQTNVPSYDQRYQEQLRQRQEQLARQDDLRYQEELRQRQEQLARQDDQRYQEELRHRQEQLARQDDQRYQEELRHRQEQLARQDDPRYQEELRQRQEQLARQDDPRYQEELRQRQEQLARQDDPRYQEELRHRQEELARQDDPRYQEELRQRQEQLARQDDPRYQEELRQRQEQHTRQDDPRYTQQQREYEERLQEYYRKRDEFMRLQQSQKPMNMDSERQDLHRQSRPVSLSEDLSHGNSLTVEDVIPHDPHPWHQVEAQFPARRRWVRKFHKRSSNKNVKNDNEVKNRKTRSTYQSNQVNYNYQGSGYASYYDSRHYSRKYWENDKYPIKEGTMENFVAYAPYRRYNRLTTIERTEPLPENFNLNFLRDQPIRRDSDYEPIDYEELTNFKLPPHLTNLPLSEKKKYWKKIVNRRYEEAKRLRNQKIKAVSMYAKYLENDLRKKMRGKIKVHYVPEYKYYLVRREEYLDNVNNLETTMQPFEKNNDDQSYYNQYITTTEAPTTTVQSFGITTKSPTLYLPTPPTTPRIYTTPVTTTSLTTPKSTEIIWNYHSKKPLDIESTINEFTSQQSIRSKKPIIEFPPITQIIDLDDYQPFDNNSQEDSDFDDIITSTNQPIEIQKVIVTSPPLTTTPQPPSIDDDPIQIVFPTKNPIKNGWTFDEDDDDDVFFFKPEVKKQNK